MNWPHTTADRSETSLKPSSQPANLTHSPTRRCHMLRIFLLPALAIAVMLATADSVVAQVATAGGSPPAIQHNGQSFRVVRAGGTSVATAGGTTAATSGSNIRQVGLIGDILHGRKSSCDGLGCDGCTSCATGGGYGQPDFTVGTYCGGGCGGSCGGTCGGSITCNGDCGGTCEQCGSYGVGKQFCCFPYGHYNGPLCDPCYNPCNTFNNPCGGRLCMPYTYVGLEALLFGRGGDGDPDFDAAFGGRITIGRIPDCAEGCEFVGTGLFGFDGDDPISTVRGFAEGNEIVGDYDGDFYSAEISKVRLVDDFARLRFGGRYIRYEESFDNGVGLNIGPPRLAPIGGGPTLVEILSANNDVSNNLIGAQIGADLFYPLAQRLYLDGRGRAGAYINFAEIDGQVTGVTQTRFNTTDPDTNTPAIGTINSVDSPRFDDEDEELAGMFEAGLGIRYLASRRLTVFLRGEVWYLTGVATSRQTLRSSLDRGIGTTIDLDDDVVFYGGSGGFELKF